MKIAVMQLAAFGDVLLATCVLKAIKKQRPNWHVTFVTSSPCAGAIENNQDTDDIIIEKFKNKKDAFDNWGHVTKKLEKSGEFDKIIIPWAGILPVHKWRLKDQSKSHNNNFMWAYPRAVQELGLVYKPPIKTYLYTTDEENQKVQKFIDGLGDGTKIMMEIAGHSGQTWWNKEWTKRAVAMLAKRFSKFDLFISHGGKEPPEFVKCRKMLKDGQAIHYMSHFTIREMSILFNHCSIMFSVSSGTANACMTHKCNPNTKWFEAVSATHWDSSPMGHDKNKFIFHQNNMDKYFNEVEKQL